MEGLRGDIIAYSSSSVTYEVPALVTALTQSTFKLKEETLLSSSLLTPSAIRIAQQAMPVRPLMEDRQFLRFPERAVFLGGNWQWTQPSVSRIRFFPNVMWTNVGKKILHA